MKKTTNLALAAIAALGLVNPPAHAADSTVTYATDNLLLGFRQTTGQGASEDYLVDLGPVQNFNFNTSFTIQSTGTTGYGSVGTDLSNIFGTGYYTTIDPNTEKTAVLFSLEADSGTTGTGTGSDPKDTLYTTVPVGTAPFNRASQSLQSGGATAIQNAGNNGYTGKTSTANSDEGIEQGTGDGSSYASYQPGGINTNNDSFKYFNPSNEGQISDTVEFERLATGTGTGMDLGTFSLDNSGDLTFTSATAVPEPATYASFFLAAASVFMIARRNRRPVNS